MADNIRIGYFLEDRGHENFIRSLTRRIAFTADIHERRLDEYVRSATGGSGNAISQYEMFLLDVAGDRDSVFDVLIVAVDSNCAGYTEKVGVLRAAAEKAGYRMLDSIVYAVPEPHIEKWYMNDPAALSAALEVQKQVMPPQHKCEKGIYKKALHDACIDAGAKPVLGGIEYGSEIAEIMDLYKAGRNDSSFDNFVKYLKACFNRLK